MIDSSNQEFLQFPCHRCKKSIGRNYGKRLETVSKQGEVTGIYIAKTVGRCVSCFSKYEWHPSKISFDKLSAKT